MRLLSRLFTIVAVLVLTSCGGDGKTQKYQTPMPDLSDMPKGPNPIVEMETSKGTIKIELFQDKAPVTVKNFLTYVKDKHYDGTIFHRVIEDFMIQGGGFEADMSERDTRAPITNESKNGLANERGTLAMARTNAPHSASAQFFINVKDNPFLDRANAQDGWGYAVFGKVIEGMDVVDKIRVVKTGIKKGQKDVPIKPVFIDSVRLVEEKKEKEETKTTATEK